MLSVDLPCLHVSHKWNRGLPRPASVMKHCGFQVQPRRGGRHCSFPWQSSTPGRGTGHVQCPSVFRAVGCAHLLAVANPAPVTVWVLHSFGNILGAGGRGLLVVWLTMLNPLGGTVSSISSDASLTSQRRKFKFREVKTLVQGHTASECAGAGI